MYDLTLYFYGGDEAEYCVRQAASGEWVIDVSTFDSERTYGGYRSYEDAFRTILDIDTNVGFIHGCDTYLNYEEEL